MRFKLAGEICETARRQAMSGEKNEGGDRSLAEAVADQLREALIAGTFSPGQKLSEQQVAAEYGVSSNTLREAFRFLTSQRLLTYVQNRGVFVATPDAEAVIDIYRVRSVIQRGAVQMATRGHPAFARMHALVLQGREYGASEDWRRVGTINMEFHRAMVSLCDSPRLSSAFDLVLAELRLAFGQLDEGAHLHAPYVSLNENLLTAIESGNAMDAVAELDAYLLKSERGVQAALQRKLSR